MDYQEAIEDSFAESLCGKTLIAGLLGELAKKPCTLKGLQPCTP